MLFLVSSFTAFSILVLRSKEKAVCVWASWAVLALSFFVFGPKPWLGLPPGKPPVDVILTIIAVVAAGATLQASGGLDCMLQVAEKILRNRPKMVTFLAPLVTFTLTILCGTGHTVYTMLPIIYDVAIKTGIRPNVRWQLLQLLHRWALFAPRFP